jgi:hypothetical protein
MPAAFSNIFALKGSLAISAAPGVLAISEGVRTFDAHTFAFHLESSGLGEHNDGRHHRLDQRLAWSGHLRGRDVPQQSRRLAGPRRAHQNVDRAEPIATFPFGAGHVHDVTGVDSDEAHPGLRHSPTNLLTRSRTTLGIAAQEHDARPALGELRC